LDVAATLTALGIGEALVSVMGDDGSPQSVHKTLIAPPESCIGPLSDAERNQVMQRSPLHGRYEASMDRQSAYEMLKQRAQAAEVEERQRPAVKRQTAGRRQRQSVGEAMIKSAARSIGSSIGRQIIRGVLGSLFGRR
jgi:hypothetical protein